MALTKLPINQGIFKNVDAQEHGDGGTAAELKNMLINDSGANVSRPGLTTFCEIGDYPIIGLTVFNDLVVAVTSDRKIYSIDQNGTETEITGSALEGGNPPVFASDGTYLAIAGGGEPRQWSGSGNTASLSGSPPDCTHISYLDGYWILHLLNDQELRWAGPTAATRATWSSANFFQAEGLPDNIVSQAVLLREFYAFGKTSTEIFFNYGDSGVPFRRTFFMDKGISAAYSISQADNTLFWLDSDRRIVQMQGRTPVVLSTPFDKEIRALSTVADCQSFTIDIEGYYLIIWVFPAAEKCYVYDYKAKIWCEFDAYTNGESAPWGIQSYTYASMWNKHLVGSASTGIIYELSKDYQDDAGSIRRLHRKTGAYSYGTGNRKRSNYYLFDIKRGVGTAGGTEPVLQVRVNDDNKGWSDWNSIGLGFPGENQEPLRVPMRGVYRKRQLEIQVTDSVDFVLRGIEEDVEILNN